MFMYQAHIPVIKQEMEWVYNIRSAVFNTILNLDYLLRFSNKRSCSMEIVTAYKFYVYGSVHR